MLRFELEQALINGGLKAEDIPASGTKHLKISGINTPRRYPGMFARHTLEWRRIGYFPTYALGNLYAAQFFEQARQEVGDLNAQFAEGVFEPLKNWLTEKIYSQGQRYRASELIEVVTGKPLSHEPLIRHLRAKYEALYGI